MKEEKPARSSKHEFSQLPGFDEAIKKISRTSREEVERRESEFKKRRKRKK